MGKIRIFLNRIRVSISKIPLKTYITIMLEGIGLLANLIAIFSYFGALNTPQSSPNFYINNQEFFAWSTVAVTYTLGLILAKMKRRWRKKNPLPSNDFFSKDNYSSEMFNRNFSFTLVIFFPIIFLYVRAISASVSSGTASPWGSLLITLLLCAPIALVGMVLSWIFDHALSLYEGD